MRGDIVGNELEAGASDIGPTDHCSGRRGLRIRAVAEGELPGRLVVGAGVTIGIDAVGKLLADQHMALLIAVFDR